MFGWMRRIGRRESAPEELVLTGGDFELLRAAAAGNLERVTRESTGSARHVSWRPSRTPGVREEFRRDDEAVERLRGHGFLQWGTCTSYDLNRGVLRVPLWLTPKGRAALEGSPGRV